MLNQASIRTAVTPKITGLWNDYFDNLGFDVMLVPATPITARPIDAAEPYSEINGRLELTLQVYSRTAEVDCPSAVPGLSIPVGLASDGLPIGLQLHSRPGKSCKRSPPLFESMSNNSERAPVSSCAAALGKMAFFPSHARRGRDEGGTFSDMKDKHGCHNAHAMHILSYFILLPCTPAIQSASAH